MGRDVDAIRPCRPPPERSNIGPVQTFTVDPRGWWIGRLFARNPLLRRSDRFEVAATLVAVVAFVVAVAVAGAVGAGVHDAERLCAVKQAQTHHRVNATVTEVRSAPNYDGSEVFVVQARWTAGNRGHADSLHWAGEVKPGDRIQIWVDSDGNRVNSLMPLRPVLDAFTAAASVMLVAVIVLIAMLALMRWRLQRARDAEWDREIRSLAKSP